MNENKTAEINKIVTSFEDIQFQTKVLTKGNFEQLMMLDEKMAEQQSDCNLSCGDMNVGIKFHGSPSNNF